MHIHGRSSQGQGRRRGLRWPWSSLGYGIPSWYVQFREDAHWLALGQESPDHGRGRGSEGQKSRPGRVLAGVVVRSRRNQACDSSKGGRITGLLRIYLVSHLYPEDQAEYFPFFFFALTIARYSVLVFKPVMVFLFFLILLRVFTSLSLLALYTFT